MFAGTGRKPTDPDYGLGSYAFDADRLGLLDEDELTERLMETFSAPGYNPPRLPAVATEILTVSQRPDVEFGAIEALLERDSLLAGELLCLARSAHYARTRPAATLHDALVRVGLKDLRSIVMQAAMRMRVFRSKSYGECMERLQEHTNCTAHLCRIISRRTAMEEEYAFLCGLLHDVGIAGILLVLGDVKRGETAPDLSSLWPAIDRAHPRAGASMVELWKLPLDVAVSVGAHHQIGVDGKDHPMAATVCLAESLATEMNMAIAPSGSGEAILQKLGLHVHSRIDQSDDRTLARATQALGLTESQLDLIRADSLEWSRAESALAG